MRTTDGQTQSIWKNGQHQNFGRPLSEDLRVDVCIVGGGIGGLMSAYLLQQEGKKVCVLEGLSIGGGQTGRSTAQLVTALDSRYSELETIHGTEGIKLAAESHRAAISKIVEIIEKEKIECDHRYVDGYLFCDPQSSPAEIEKEFGAAHRAGLTDVAKIATWRITNTAHPEAQTSLCFPRQLQLDPQALLNGLAKVISARGGHIFQNTHVTEVKNGNEACVTTSEGTAVRADHVIVATNSPINDRYTMHTKQSPYRSYVIALKVPPNSVEQALFWDTAEPFHYVRRKGDDTILVGGEDHKTGQEEHPEGAFIRLEAWARNFCPQAGEVIARWSGQVMESVDGLGYLGRNPFDAKNIFIMTGDSGNGMTHGIIGAMLINDQIQNRKNPWEELYSPGRVKLRSALDFARENMNVAAQYADWLQPGEADQQIEDLAPGQGIIVRNGLSLAAIARGEDGQLQSVSAVCPHLGAIVRWNAVEKTWDCPCHGSRFEANGKVVEGPAVSDLSPIDIQIPATTPAYVDQGINPVSAKQELKNVWHPVCKSPS